MMLCRLVLTVLALVLANGSQLQHNQAAIMPVTAVRVGPVNARDVSLGNLIDQLSENTHVAFCIENRDNANRMRSTLGSLSINLNIDPVEDLQAVLSRLERTYPVVQWSVSAGVIVIGSRDIKNDPLEMVIKASAFQGTVGQFVAYLNSKTPGLMADTLEISGMYDRNAVYALEFKSDVTVREALSALTREYGIRWTATIRDEGTVVQIPDAADGKSTEVRTGRVTLMFSRGSAPQRVR